MKATMNMNTTLMIASRVILWRLRSTCLHVQYVVICLHGIMHVEHWSSTYLVGVRFIFLEPRLPSVEPFFSQVWTMAPDLRAMVPDVEPWFPIWSHGSKIKSHKIDVIGNVSTEQELPVHSSSNREGISTKFEKTKNMVFFFSWKKTPNPSSLWGGFVRRKSLK